jgi:CRP/FNR family transcriptional regulator, cyclic AMP receptor protein
MYVEQGNVRLSVLSRAGKGAVVAVLDVAYFFGEGCLAGQSQRMATATAMTASTIVVVEEDLIDQLFNSSEKRLARALLLLARYGEPDALTGPCRACLRRRSPRWWARRGRASTSS